MTTSLRSSPSLGASLGEKILRFFFLRVRGVFFFSVISEWFLLLSIGFPCFGTLELRYFFKCFVRFFSSKNNKFLKM